MLTIEAGADNDSIYVDSSGNQGGNVGFGTTSPAVDLDVLSGNTPTLRLRQDASSGFGPQTWDLAGNESNFFIRDVTNGSALPFRIEPGTASNTLYLDNQEFIGIGTTAPQGILHMRRAGQLKLLFENSSNGNEWSFTLATDGSMRVSAQGTGGPEFEIHLDGTVEIGPGGTPVFTIDPSGNVTMSGNLTVSGGGGCTGC